MTETTREVLARGHSLSDYYDEGCDLRFVTLRSSPCLRDGVTRLYTPRGEFLAEGDITIFPDFGYAVRTDSCAVLVDPSGRELVRAEGCIGPDALYREMIDDVVKRSPTLRARDTVVEEMVYKDKLVRRARETGRRSLWMCRVTDPPTWEGLKCVNDRVGLAVHIAPGEDPRVERVERLLRDGIEPTEYTPTIVDVYDSIRLLSDSGSDFVFAGHTDYLWEIVRRSWSEVPTEVRL